METNKIEKYKQEMKSYPIKSIKQILEITLKEIRFLEDIYMSCKQWNCFSDEFHNSAYKERQELCLKSSACYSLLREQEEKEVKE